MIPAKANYLIVPCAEANYEKGLRCSKCMLFNFSSSTYNLCILCAFSAKKSYFLLQYFFLERTPINMSYHSPSFKKKIN